MNLIVVVDKFFGIGKEGGLLTHLPKDLNMFKNKTKGNIIVMGRKTVESLPGGRLLPNRETWILSRNPSYKKENATVFHSIDEMMNHIEMNHIESDRIYITGGAAIYNMFLPIVETAYITKIDFDFHADVHINNVETEPSLYLDHVSEVYTHNGFRYQFTTYQRK